jgi:hypothetical protein
MSAPADIPQSARIDSNTPMNRWREFGLFLICSILICLVVFHGAFWGSRILAPLDIAPAIFSKYRYVDPTAANIPANHYIIDQLTFDLPLQYTIYHAYRAGEIPCWDPYTYAGRPLLADAHVNGTDPIRILCYLTLPFVSAYNWNLILKSILTGLGMFLLLRHLRFPLSISLPLALTYQFAGCFAIFFSHPWIQASFAYYPFLWVAWSIWIQHNSLRYIGIGALFCALIFYSGNLQSHSYLPLFALCFLFGNGFGHRRLVLRLFLVISLSILAGAALAAPVLWPQVEFYLNSLRTASFAPSSGLSYLTGIASLSAFFPWSLGTFRTLDLGKFLGNDALGFVIYIGSAAFVSALLGAWKGREVMSEQNGARRTAIGLVLVYLIVCSTPLLPILYTRIAPIAVIGSTVLAAFGLTVIRERAFPKLGWAVAGAAVAAAVGLNVAAFIVYPRVVNYVHSLVESQDKTNTTFTETPALRSFQVENLPREISIQNPETIVAFVSLIALAIYVRRPPPTYLPQFAIAALNFLPLIFFFCRYVPNYPVAYWERLLSGGPEQHRVVDLINPDHFRLLEKAPSFSDMLFPNDMGHLWRAHTVHGYSALQPLSLYNWHSAVESLAPPIADFIYASEERGVQTGKLTQLSKGKSSRVHCDQRPVEITAETMNTLTVSIAPGTPDRLLRTDTFYPGWQAELNGQSIPLERDDSTPFSSINLPASESNSILIYTYRPSHFILTILLSFVACILVLGLLVYHPLKLRSATKPVCGDQDHHLTKVTNP